jgi:predicted ATPase
LELIDLMRSTPDDVQKVIRYGGGIQEWLWKGEGRFDVAILTFDIQPNFKKIQLQHDFLFEELKSQFKIFDEKILGKNSANDQKDTIYFEYLHGDSKIRSNGQLKKIKSVKEDASILAQIRDPENYPELAILTSFYENVRLYREWSFGRNTNFRRPQPSDQRNDRLEPDFSNIGLFLNRLRRDPKTKRELIKHLQYLYEGISDFEVNIVEGGYVQILFTEGDFSVPASRLSDGTLRYLCLLAILLDPNPPALICLEEPELGLHPDILPHLTDLLVEASERTQLIVTTHSQMIVDSLSEQPESILVCEKHDGQTKIERLDKEKLGPWLEEYTLGSIWSKGEIGGNRW